VRGFDAMHVVNVSELEAGPVFIRGREGREDLRVVDQTVRREDVHVDHAAMERAVRGRAPPDRDVDRGRCLEVEAPAPGRQRE